MEWHENERDLKVHIWYFTTKDDLKELISITYTNKVHLLFDSLSLKKFIIKCVWHEVVMEWVIFKEVSQKVCEWEVRTKHATKFYVGLWGDLESRQNWFLKS